MKLNVDMGGDALGDLEIKVKPGSGGLMTFEFDDEGPEVFTRGEGIPLAEWTLRTPRKDIPRNLKKKVDDVVLRETVDGVNLFTLDDSKIRDIGIILVYEDGVPDF